MSETVRFTFEGKPLEGRHGESLAAALVSAGIVAFRETRGGEMRGMFCGMGVCQDCLIEVDGKPNQRACMTKLERPMTVRREMFGRTLPEVASGEPPKLIDDVTGRAAGGPCYRRRAGRALRGDSGAACRRSGDGRR